mmetsp:Transcript_8173/g.14746  ORF Transcript_8173/g.14746 Transcript_8173/m.14746 type:complete len:153 (-) Transcript_8173:75-533(-)
MIAEHARRLLQFGRLRALASLGHAMLAIGGMMPFLLVAASKATGGSDPRTDPGRVDALSALAIVHGEFSSIMSDPEALNDAVSLHDSCVAAGYAAWGVAFATLLEHQPTLQEFKERSPAAWTDYSRAVKSDANFAVYWRVMEAVDTEITPAG